MRRALVLLCVCLLATAARADGESAARAVASVAPSEGAVAGQRVVLSLKLMTQTWFTGAPTLPDPAIEGAIVKRYSSTGVNATDRIDGESWTSQTWEWFVYPRKAGRYEVPALAATIRVSGEGRKTVEVETSTEAFSFVVEEPAGTEGRHYAFAAPAFSIEESLDPKPESPMVGTSLRREITMTVEDAPAMLLPPLTVPERPGATAYPDTPLVKDEFVRGDLTGVRTESVTYVFTREGIVRLPEIRIPWWNTATGSLEEAIVEAHDLTIRPNPDLDPSQLARLRGEETDAAAAGRSPIAWFLDLWPWLVGGLIALLVVLRLVRRHAPAVRRRIEEARVRRRESEAAIFEPFREACATNDAPRAAATLRAWLDRAAGPDVTLEQFTTRADDDALAREAERLQHVLYGDGRADEWRGAALAERVAGARRAMRRTPAGGPLEETLSLNPKRSTGV